MGKSLPWKTKAINLRGAGGLVPQLESSVFASEKGGDYPPLRNGCMVLYQIAFCFLKPYSLNL